MGQATWEDEYRAAIAAHQRQEWAVARAGYDRALAIDPTAIPVVKALGVLLSQTGDLEGGIESMKLATELDPEDAETWSNLSYAYFQMERNDEAVEAGRHAVALSPENPFAHANLSAALRQMHDYQGAWDEAQEVLRIRPEMVEGHINAACCLSAVGDIDASNSVMAQAVASNPHNFAAWDLYLFNLHYSDKAAAADILEAHELYGGMFQSVARPAGRGGGRTVGFVSGDLIQHPVGKFIQPLFEHYDKSKWTFKVFHNRDAEDEISAKLKGMVDGWFGVARLNDEDLVDLIRREDVDILIDLSGHSARNRLTMFSRRPAPVQATFLGYSSTTGLEAMDFLVADEVLVPEGDESKYREKTVCMDRCAYCLPVKSGSVPERSEGPVRFGSFNNPYKISGSLIRAWAEILRGVSGSKLVMKYPTFEALEVQESFRAKFQEAGIPGDWIEFYGWVEYEEHLRIVGTVDVALDSFPYTGATTTTDSLRSLTPVVTLAGDRFSARMAASILHAFDLDELVVESVEEYVRLATDLGLDEEKRRDLRSRMATRVESSTFSDGAEYARSFERALEKMWLEVFPPKT